MQNSTEALPILWEQLRDWLENARRREEAYRSLVLPARREHGWTNIGYSIDLAFPHRSDHQNLLELLGTQHLLGREPSTKAVLAALEGRGNRFSAQFNEVLADFAEAVRRGDRPWNHAFWRAVREACLAEAPARQTEARLLMNAEPTGFQPYLLVRSEEEAQRLGFETTTFATILDDFPLAIHRGDDYELPVRALLAGRIVVSRITANVDDGILAFAPLQEVEYTWVPSSRLHHATHALVRRDRSAQFRAAVRQRKGARPMRERPSRFDGWVEFENVELAQQGPTKLAVAETLVPPTLEIENDTGVAIRDGWLGEDGLFPRIVAEGAREVRVRPLERQPEAAFGVETLEIASDEATWRFPPGRREGAFLVEAEFSDGVTSTLQVRFYRTPLHTGFQPPTRVLADRSFVEAGTSDVVPLDVHVPAFASLADHHHDHIDIASDAIYLGPTVGEWSGTRYDKFAWLLMPNARPRLRFIGDPQRPFPPTGTAVQCKSAARAWRRCFGRPDIAGPTEVVHAYRAVVRHAPVPVSDILGAQFPKPVIEDPSPATPHPGVRRLIAALAASGVQRSAIAEAELLRLTELAFDLEGQWELRFALLRAWVEAGVLEQVSDFQWSGRRYIVRRPRLVLYRLGAALHAAVMGLATPAVHARIEKLAHARGAHLDGRCSVSEWVPNVPLLDLPSTEVGAEIAREAELALPEWLPALPSLVADPSQVVKYEADGNLPPGRRIQTWDWDRGTFQEGELRGAGVHLYRCSAKQSQRTKEPDRLYIRSADGRRRWSFSRTWAFLAAHQLRGESPFESDGLAVFPKRGSGARLPLPLARAIAVLSPATGGPVIVDGRLRHKYWFPSVKAVHAVLGTLSGVDRGASSCTTP
jgi:hypothetical protein